MAALDQNFTDHPPLDGGNDVASAVAFPSVARTSTPNPAIFSNYSGTGLIVVIDMTVGSGTGVTFTIEGVDRASNKTWVILTSTAKSSAATTVLRVHPNLAASANVTAQDMVPKEFLIRAAHSDGASLTYSVGVHLSD